MRSEVFDPCAYSRLTGDKLFIVLIYVDDLIQVEDTDRDVLDFQMNLTNFYR